MISPHCFMHWTLVVPRHLLLASARLQMQATEISPSQERTLAFNENATRFFPRDVFDSDAALSPHAVHAWRTARLRAVRWLQQADCQCAPVASQSAPSRQLQIGLSLAVSPRHQMVGALPVANSLNSWSTVDCDAHPCCFRRLCCCRTGCGRRRCGRTTRAEQARVATRLDS